MLDVLAAGVHHVDLIKASGAFYLSPPPIPSVLGTVRASVQLGNKAGAVTELPAAAVRSVALDLMGFATFHAPAAERREAYRELAPHAAAGRLSVDVGPVPWPTC